jgi:UDP-2-acetamido-3-amino-2,3-dideoxy-glucuronate N-acetyltransferase
MSNVYIDPTAIIDEPVNIGSGTKIWHFVHIMKDAQIGKECILADYVYIGKGVIIGNKVKLENRVNVYDGVTIQDNVFVGPHVTFTNDLYPRSLNPDWKILPTLVKQGSSIGAGSVIVCGVTIGENALIGAGSVVTNDIPPFALVYGNPARVRSFICKCGTKLETEEKNEKIVLMVCSCCKERYTIPLEDYAEIK